MPFCPYCSHQVESIDIFCGGCGKALPADPHPGPEVDPTEPPTRTLAYRISPTRILVMSLLSYGIYLFYWFYLSWQQYRDHTGNLIFPMWHTISILIPVYGQFRTHAHVLCIKELMINADLACNIRVGWSVTLVLVSQVLGYLSFIFNGGFFTYWELTLGTALLSGLLGAVTIAIALGLLLNVQQNLNRYWASLENVTLVDLNVGAGEIILAAIGVVTWIITIASIVSPAFREL